MPWQLVGNGRKMAPALDPNDASYAAWWTTTLDIVNRYAAAATRPTNETQHLLHQLPDYSPLQRYPNCALFGKMGNHDPTSIIERAFIYGRPLTAIAYAHDDLYALALQKIRMPRTDSCESWYPVPFESLTDDADNPATVAADEPKRYRVYKTVVLRVAMLLRCIKMVYMQRTSVRPGSDGEERREHFVGIEQRLQHWLHAHMLFMIQISELGHIPHDHSPAMHILIARCAPDVHTALSEGDLPDMSAEIERASFFTQSVGARKSDPFVYTFSKALPHRCEVRQVAEKITEVSAYNAGYFAFVKVVLAAMFLGIYRRNNYRPGWRLAFAVYRLFFSTMDRRLLPYRIARRSADGTPLPLGGTAASLAHEYNLHQLCEAVLTPLSPTRRARAVQANTRLQYTNYASIVAHKYLASLETKRKQESSTSSGSGGGSRKKSATEMRKDATRFWRANYVPQLITLVHTRFDDDDGASALAPMSDNLQSADELRATTTIIDSTAKNVAEEFCEGLYVANSMGRIMYEKTCGHEYYEQRATAGTLPNTGVRLRDGSFTQAPKPAPPGTQLTYKDACKNVLPIDRQLPSEEALERDAILYHWISTLMIKDKQAPNKKRKLAGGRATSANRDDEEREDDDDDGAGAADEEDDADDDGGKPKKPTKSSIEREYIFQNAMNLAVREYLIYGLQNRCEALRHELCGRVQWASWEESVLIFGDNLRRRLDELYVDPCPLGAFLTSYSAYQWITNAARGRPINNHYTSERESFLVALKRLMKAKINNDDNKKKEIGFGDKPVDHVVPRETDILIQHLLQSWRYPRVAPPLKFDAVPRNVHARSASSDTASTTSTPVFEQFQEKNVTPQLVYLIEPVSAAAMPPDVAAGGAEAIKAYIRTEYVERSRFPLGIFHISNETLARFSACRSAYHLSPSDPVVKDFIDWLAKRSAYEFYLLRSYCKIMERYMEIHTFALPRHIAEHQLNALRTQFCIPDNVEPPRHLMRSFVCLGCKRCASVFPTPNQRHSAQAVGNDEVRFVSRTDDDEVYERVRARAYMPLPLSALAPARSWTEVLQHRSQPTSDVYDRYCLEPVYRSELEMRRALPQPECVTALPDAPTEADIEHYAHELFADTFSDANRARYAPAADRRDQLYSDEAGHPNPAGKAHAPVARGKGRLGEMDFDAALWSEVNRRMRIFDAGGSENERSFLLLGHSIEGASGEYAEIKWCDTTQRIKAESKKAKQSSAQLLTAKAIVDDTERARKLKAYASKRRRDADSMARFAQCSRQRMIEIDFCGRALRAADLYIAGRAQADPDDCVLSCCDCLARIWLSQAHAIGDRVLCTQCYVDSKHSGGQVAQRAIRGESTKSVSATAPSTLDAGSANRTRSTPLQTQLSPSFSQLCSDVIPLGTCCRMDRCKAIKTDKQKMFSLEVLQDTSVGNETYAYVDLCAKHARMYARMFRVVAKLPFSTLRMFMMQGRRDFAEVVSRGSYLDDVMRRAAHSTGIGTQARAEEELKKTKKSDTQKQRKQRQVAIAESTRQREAASSAVMK